MTVLELVKTYQLGDFSKNYHNVYGNCVDLKYPIDKLITMEVKDVYINLKSHEARITIIDI